MKVLRYTPEMRSTWDAFVNVAKNATFLFQRDYMDYHADRFADHSLLFYTDKDKLLALMPANEKDSTLISHGGLTYGGIISDIAMTTPRMLEAFESLHAYARMTDIQRIIYKTVPSIYSSHPSEEDLYALFRNRAVLFRRDVLAVIDQSNRLAYQERRARKIKQARNAGLRIISKSTDYASFWLVLEENLLQRYNVKPVHNLAEIELLAARFPDNIHLHVCLQDKEILAGVVVYATPKVAHIQYISASAAGKSIGALDFLFASLIESVYSEHSYFDFGISTEQDGQVLNQGLIEQKEGFGARAIIHDHYEMVIR